MLNTDKIDISLGKSARSRIWKNKKTTWPELVNRLSEENCTNETLAEFMAANREEQLTIKDVGGYVGGYLRNGRRKPENVVHRQILTLDLDFAHSYFWEDFTMRFEYAAAIHSTHKHCSTSPRYRLILPLSREVTPDEYVAAARQLAGQIGIELFDNTTFETNRLMFWPSNPKDQDYFFESQSGPWVDIDELLGLYADWTDSSLWPTAEKEIRAVKEAATKQQDPTEKTGLVGAFCKAHTMTEAIETFLKEVYVPAPAGRYTYERGTAAAGLTLYDDKFAYSHHGTDPCGGKLCNAFDLVRVHLFGHLDTGAAKSGKLASFKAMEELVIKDKKVKGILAEEGLAAAQYDFAEELPEDEESKKWVEDLAIDSKGAFLSSASNLNLVFNNAKGLKGKFRQNDFDGKRYLWGSVPWRKIDKPEPFKDVDFSGLRNYLESIYGITAALKIDDSLALEFQKYSFHPVRDYLLAQKWDRVERVDMLLIDYFGAEDNPYVREAMRKMLAGAVARILSPGIKFDLVLTLVGAQGTGKSTFVSKLGGDWFSDSFSTVKGNAAFEQLQGSWLIEMAELSGLRKVEVEAVKHYISKQVDIFRPAYGRVILDFPRQCVFFGTTNNKDFLRDPSGNRRFMPVDIDPEKATKDIFLLEEDEVGQIWAEAVELYRHGERLYLSRDAELKARREQRRHSETDERVGLIEDYLDKLLPANWAKIDTFARRDYLRETSDELSPKGTTERQIVCVAEVWCECLGKEKEDMDRYKTREINDILRGLEGWGQSKSTKNFGPYGKQKYYFRENLL